MGGAKQGALTGSETAARRVIVSGDVTADWNLARTRKLADSGIAWNAADRTEMYGQPGGATLMAGLMTEVAKTIAAEGVAVEVSGPNVPTGPIVPGDPRFHHSYAIWARFPRKRGDRDKPIWRVEEFLGLDRARTPEAAVSEHPASARKPAKAGVVILDDADLGFRAAPEHWPAVLHLSDPEPAPHAVANPWVLLKMACPVASGELWRRLLRFHAGRLIVVMTLNDLRLSDVKISRELWRGSSRARSPAIRSQEDGRGEMHETAGAGRVLRWPVLDSHTEPAVTTPRPVDARDKDAPEGLVAACWSSLGP
jgi:hypothetical protein